MSCSECLPPTNAHKLTTISSIGQQCELPRARATLLAEFCSCCFDCYTLRLLSPHGEAFAFFFFPDSSPPLKKRRHSRSRRVGLVASLWPASLPTCSVFVSTFRKKCLAGSISLCGCDNCSGHGSDRNTAAYQINAQQHGVILRKQTHNSSFSIIYPAMQTHIEPYRSRLSHVAVGIKRRPTRYALACCTRALQPKKNARPPYDNEPPLQQ